MPLKNEKKPTVLFCTVGFPFTNDLPRTPKPIGCKNIRFIGENLQESFDFAHLSGIIVIATNSQTHTKI